MSLLKWLFEIFFIKKNLQKLEWLREGHGQVFISYALLWAMYLKKKKMNWISRPDQFPLLTEINSNNSNINNAIEQFNSFAQFDLNSRTNSKKKKKIL